MKSSFLNLGVAAAALSAAVLSACAQSGGPKLPPPIASAVDLKAKGKASVVFGMAISTAVKSPQCGSASTMLVKIGEREQIGVFYAGQPVGVGAGLGYGNVYVGFAELDEGTYAVAEVDCQNFGNYSVSYRFHTEDVAFAHFKVKAGEVVDLGSFHLNMFDPDATIIDPVKKPVPIVIVSEAPEQQRTKFLPEPLRAEAVYHPMISQFPANAVALDKACQQQRLFRSTHGVVASAFSLLEFAVDAPICKFTGVEKTEKRGN